MAAVTFVSQVSLPSAHGMITFPPSRVGGTLDCGADEHNGCHFVTPGTRHRSQSTWYSNAVQIPGEATIPYDSPLITIGCMNRTVDCTPKKPWRAPGSAPVKSPCGIHGGGPGRDGDETDGRALMPVPESQRAVWQVGREVEVAWAIWANHRGGFSWRLCPATEELTEECFQRHPLDMLGPETTLRFTDGTRTTIPALRTKTGTVPAGSQWTRNPIPRATDGPGFPFPIDGLRSDFANYSLVEKVVVPDVAAGDWVLGWRWDSEESYQVWQGCADVRIVTDSLSV